VLTCRLGCHLTNPKSAAMMLPAACLRLGVRMHVRSNQVQLLPRQANYNSVSREVSERPALNMMCALQAYTGASIGAAVQLKYGQGDICLLTVTGNVPLMLT
jgi:hypothetical protein